MQWLEDRCQQHLKAAADKHLRRYRPVVQFQDSRIAQISGQDFLQFSSNDYLGLASAPLGFANEAQELAISLNQTGAGASPLVSGYSPYHESFEQQMAKYLGFESALYCNSGFSANESILRTCISSSDVVFADRLNHASLIDGVRASKALSKRYTHLDMNMLEQLLHNTPVPKSGQRWIVTDAVFSMDGHIAPLKRIVDLARQYDAALYVDDAHGFGVFGAGKGTCHGLGIDPQDIDILMVTCGKSLGVSGACVLSRTTVIEFLIQACRAYVYSTAVSPLLLQLCSIRLSQLQHEHKKRDSLSALGSYLYSQLQKLSATFGFELKHEGQVIDGFHHPVQPIILGSSETVMLAHGWLKAKGILVGGIRPPTVPKETGRLRVSINAEHQRSDIDKLIHELSDFGRQN